MDHNERQNDEIDIKYDERVHKNHGKHISCILCMKQWIHVYTQCGHDKMKISWDLGYVIRGT